MFNVVTTTGGEKVYIDTGTPGGTIKITLGEGEPLYLTADEARKMVDILKRYTGSRS